MLFVTFVRCFHQRRTTKFSLTATSLLSACCSISQSRRYGQLLPPDRSTERSDWVAEANSGIIVISGLIIDFFSWFPITLLMMLDQRQEDRAKKKGSSFRSRDHSSFMSITAIWVEFTFVICFCHFIEYLNVL